MWNHTAAATLPGVTRAAGWEATSTGSEWEAPSSAGGARQGPCLVCVTWWSCRVSRQALCGQRLKLSVSSTSSAVPAGVR